MAREKPTAITSWAILFDQQQEVFYKPNSTDRIAHTMVFVIPVIEYWLE